MYLFPHFPLTTYRVVPSNLTQHSVFCLYIFPLKSCLCKNTSKNCSFITPLAPLAVVFILIFTLAFARSLRPLLAALQRQEAKGIKIRILEKTRATERFFEGWRDKKNKKTAKARVSKSGEENKFKTDNIETISLGHKHKIKNKKITI